jgi:predicted Fe-Mo cluster-binding NifX family protein
MKLAIPVLENKGDQSPISEHFGHADYFAFAEINDGNYEINVIENPMAETHEPGQIPYFMKENNVDVMVVRGIGGRAIQFFSDLGIQIYRGASGSVKEIVEEYIKGNVEDKEYEVQDKHHHNGH